MNNALTHTAANGVTLTSFIEDDGLTVTHVLTDSTGNLVRPAESYKSDTSADAAWQLSEGHSFLANDIAQ